MSESFNPNLINPNAQVFGQVPALPAASGPGFTQPYPNVEAAEEKFYTCTMPNHHMTRPDGKRLAFMFGILKTQWAHDIAYLDKEIKEYANPFIREATDAEIQSFRMRTNPRGTIADEIRPEIEAQVRDTLTAKLLATLDAQGIQLTDAQKQELLDSAIQTVEPTAGQAPTDEQKLQSTDVLTKLRAMSSTGVHVLGGISGTDKMPNSASSNS